MRQISYWAKNHVWQSRLLIGIIYVLLNVLGIFIGNLLDDINVTMPGLYFTICFVVATGLLVGYPDKRLRERLSSSALYFRRKLFDFLLGAVTFLMIIYISNNWQHLTVASESAQASKVIPAKEVTNRDNSLMENFISKIQSNDVSKLSHREKIKMLKDQLKVINHDKKSTKTEKTIYIILSILLAIGLLIGLTALSCSIACAGSEALAIVVALAGTFLIIFLLVRLIKSISHPKQEAKEAINK